MNIKNKNFLLTKDDEVRVVLLKQGLIELNKQDEYYVFVNEPKKLNSIQFEKLNMIPVDKLCF